MMLWSFIKHIVIITFFIIVLVAAGLFSFYNVHEIILNFGVFGVHKFPAWLFLFSFFTAGFFTAFIFSRFELLKMFLSFKYKQISKSTDENL